jgi:hypothetical protein
MTARTSGVEMASGGYRSAWSVSNWSLMDSLLPCIWILFGMVCCLIGLLGLTLFRPRWPLYGALLGIGYGLTLAACYTYIFVATARSVTTIDNAVFEFSSILRTRELQAIELGKVHNLLPTFDILNWLPVVITFPSGWVLVARGIVRDSRFRSALLDANPSIHW